MGKIIAIIVLIIIVGITVFHLVHHVMFCNIVRWQAKATVPIVGTERAVRSITLRRRDNYYTRRGFGILPFFSGYLPGCAIS